MLIELFGILLGDLVIPNRVKLLQKCTSFLFLKAP